MFWVESIDPIQMKLFIQAGPDQRFRVLFLSALKDISNDEYST